MDHRALQERGKDKPSEWIRSDIPTKMVVNIKGAWKIYTCHQKYWITDLSGVLKFLCCQNSLMNSSEH